MSTLILLLIFITLKKNTKSAPISKHMTGRENYGIPNDPDSKSSNKITDDENHHHNHHDRPSLKKLHSRKNLTAQVSTQNPLSENFATQYRSSRFSEGKVDEIINNPFKGEEFETEKYATSDTVTSDKISRQFLNDLLILLFIGTVCLTFVVMSSWVFYNQARKFRKQSPDIEKQEPEICVKSSETPMEVYDTYSRISKILKKSNSEHDQRLLEELVDILRKNVEIPSVKEETDNTQNNDEDLLKSDLKEIEKLTTVECTEEESCDSSSIPDLPQYLMETTNEPTFPTVTQEKVVTECKEMVSPKEQQQLVYHAVMDNYRNDAITPNLHFLGKDVSTSTEDLQSLDLEEGIDKPLSDYKTEKEPDLDHSKKIHRLKEETPKEDLEKTYFLTSEIKKDDSRISVSVQTVDPNDSSFVRRVKFDGEVTVKYYLVNQPIHAFDKRRKRNKTFEIREVVETYPTKRRDGLGKCKTMKRAVKSRVWVESKHSPRSVHHLCTCCQKDNF